MAELLPDILKAASSLWEDLRAVQSLKGLGFRV